MNFSLDILIFYGVVFIFLTYLLHRKTTFLYSVLISMLIVMVASEYYEIPIFIAGFLGLWGNHPYPSLPFILHHVNTIMLFVWLIYVAKVKIWLTECFLLIFGVLANTVFLFANPGNPEGLWYARFIGIYILSGVVYIGSSLVGPKP